MKKKLISRNLMEPRVQEIGKIKIGRRGKKRGKGYIPEKLDYFEVTTRDRKGGTGPFVRDEEVHGHPLVGEQPRELRGILMFPEIEQNILTEMCHYEGRRASIRCDGETMIDIDGRVGECFRAAGGECPCKPYIRLHLQLMASPHTEGYYTFRSTSWETVNNIQTALESIYDRFGTLFEAPVKLKMYQSEDLYLEKGETKSGRSWKVALVLDMSWQEAALHMVEAKELLNTTREKLMLKGETVVQELDAYDEEAAAEIADEFFPPEDDAPPPVIDADYEVEGEEEEPAEEEVQEEDPEEEEVDVDLQKLIVTVIAKRDEARGADLLDAKGEQFITDAMESKNKEDLTKARLALERILAAKE